MKRRDALWWGVLLVMEMVVGFGLLGWLYRRAIIGDKLFFLTVTLLGLVLALYYGVPGMVGAFAGAVGVALWVLPVSPRVFAADHLPELGFLLVTLTLVGAARSQWENRAVTAEINNDILSRRLERLNLDLTQRDHALREVFETVLIETESPHILYQGFRRLRFSEDRETLFRDVLELLYTHCHVEKSCIYEPKGRDVYQRLAVFGDSRLPEVLRWKSEEMPEILRVAASEKQVIIPKQIGPQFFMGIPILDTRDNLAYVLLIEEIRFINFSENVITLLKVASLWIKSLIEDRLAREELLPYSRYRSVVVIAPEHTRKFLKETVRQYEKFKLPYALLSCRGSISEETARSMEMQIRLFDGMYLTSDEELVIFLAMVAEPYVARVIQRLQPQFPDLEISSVSKEDLGI